MIQIINRIILVEEVGYKWYLSAMFMFLLTAVPLMVFLIFSLYSQWREDRKSLVEDIIWGIRVFITALIVFLIIRYFLKGSWDLKGLFIYLTLRDFSLWAFFAITGYFILYGFEQKDFVSKTGEVLGYFSGFYILTGIIDTIIQFGHYDPYCLFILPMFRMAFIILFSMILGLTGNLDFRFQLPSALGCIALTLTGGLAGMFFYSNHAIGAWAIAGAVLVGAVVSMVYILIKSR